MDDRRSRPPSWIRRATKEMHGSSYHELQKRSGRDEDQRLQQQAIDKARRER